MNTELNSELNVNSIRMKIDDKISSGDDDDDSIVNVKSNKSS